MMQFQVQTHKVLSTSKVKASALRISSNTSADGCSFTPAACAATMAVLMRSSYSAVCTAGSLDMNALGSGGNGSVQGRQQAS